MDLKTEYYHAIMYLYLGNESAELEKWGEAVIYLKTAHEKMTACAKLAKVRIQFDNVKVSYPFALLTCCQSLCA